MFLVATSKLTSAPELAEKKGAPTNATNNKKKRKRSLETSLPPYETTIKIANKQLRGRKRGKQGIMARGNERRGEGGGISHGQPLRSAKNKKGSFEASPSPSPRLSCSAKRTLSHSKIDGEAQEKAHRSRSARWKDVPTPPYRARGAS